VLRQKDVMKFKTRITGHPGRAGRLSHCPGLSDELGEVEIYMATLVRAVLSDMHEEPGSGLSLGVQSFLPPG
jgi:hypothetical protein